MNILGISAYYHDSAAALVRDGWITAAAQEERFTRRKHDPNFPKHAIGYCLREAELRVSDLDHVAFYERPLEKLERLLETYIEHAPRSLQSFRRALPLWASQKVRITDLIEEELGPAFSGTLHLADHHQSHAASAFYPSPFPEAAILTLDAVGEWSTSSISVGKGNHIQSMREMRFPHSLGMLYSAFTEYTGFKVNSGEYKLMGLAPYGEPRWVQMILDNVVQIGEDGSIELDMSYFDFCGGLTMTSERLHALFGEPPRPLESRITQREMDIAASIQKICELAVLRAAAYAHKTTGQRRLAMAGGVALNCVANGRLLREGPFDDVWVQPASGDAGGALGCALLVWHEHLEQPRAPQPADSQCGSLLGPRYGDDEIAFLLNAISAQYTHYDNEEDLLERVASLIDEGMVIGWFHGRMEYGPRALGCRSIIGDPRASHMQRKMNLKIKFRESFRPFAPCVLRERAHEVFHMGPDQESPYMLFVSPVRKDWLLPPNQTDAGGPISPDLNERLSAIRSKLPAITHVDNSARVQTVDEARHGRFYRLIKKFNDKTDCPVIVNTSFNIRGEPIVCSPGDAFRCFSATDMDCLVLENFVLRKDEQSGPGLADAEAYRSQYELD